MPDVKSIVKNTSYLSAAYIGQKLLSFIYFTLIARVAGVVDTGAYVFALSYATIFAVFVDFGLAQFIQREIAQERETIQSITRKTLGLKLFYAVFAVGLGVGIIQLMDVDALTRLMVYVAMGLMIVDSFNLTIWSVFRGIHRLSYEAIGIVLSQVITLIVGVTALYLNASIIFLIIALLTGSLITSLYAMILIRKKCSFWPTPSIKSISLKQAKSAATFGFANIFTRVFASIDSVLLRQLVGPAAVGFYSVPNKVVFAAQFIPAAFSASIYPAMSYHFVHDKKKMMQIFEQSMLFLLILSVPMAFGLFVLAEPVTIRVFTEEFLPSVLGMQILAWGIIFGFVEFPLGALIAAIDQQRKNTITRAVVMVVNIILNVLLIPMYSFIGACIAALVSYMTLVGMGVYWVHKALRPNWKPLQKASLLTLFSAALMAGGVYLLQPHVPLVVSILLGAWIYVGAIFIFKVITRDTLRQVLAQFSRVK